MRTVCASAASLSSANVREPLGDMERLAGVSARFAIQNVGAPGTKGEGDRGHGAAHDSRRADLSSCFYANLEQADPRRSST
jgi:hypothetical protein